MKRLFVSLIVFSLMFMLCPEVQARILFQDDFGDANLDGWSVMNNASGEAHGNWRIQDGVLQYELDGTSHESGFLRLDLLHMPESFTVEYDERLVAPNSNGGPDHQHLYVNFLGWDNHLDCVLMQKAQDPGVYDDILLVQTINGKRLAGYTPDCLVRLPFWEDEQQWHHFKYVKEGNLVSFSFDSEPIYSYTLPVSIKGGQLVLAASAGTYQFDNVFLSTPGPRACYPLDGNLSDASGNGYNLIVSSQFEYSWLADSAGAVLNIPSQHTLDRSHEAPCAYGLQYPGTGGWTVMAWVFVNEQGGYIIQQSVPLMENHEPYCLSMVPGSPGQFYFQIESREGKKTALAYPMRDFIGQWVHLSGVYDQASSLRLYINGELKAETSTTLVPETLDIAPTYLGGNRWGSDSRIKLADAKVYAYALTASEVLEAMKSHRAFNAGQSANQVVSRHVSPDDRESTIQLAGLRPQKTMVGKGVKSQSMVGFHN
jgi:hypothetical protein